LCASFHKVGWSLPPPPLRQVGDHMLGCLFLHAPLTQLLVCRAVVVVGISRVLFLVRVHEPLSTTSRQTEQAGDGLQCLRTHPAYYVGRLATDETRPSRSRSSCAQYIVAHVPPFHVCDLVQNRSVVFLPQSIETTRNFPDAVAGRLMPLCFIITPPPPPPPKERDRIT